MANGIDIGNLSLSDDVVIGSIQIPIIKGDKGDTGEAGKIISVQIIMLSSTATAYADNIGTQTNAKIVLGIPRGANISTTTINQVGELIITLDNGSELNAGQVVGRGISNVSMNEDWDFVVTLTDGSTIIVGNLENEIKNIIEEYLEDYYTKAEIDGLIPTKTSDLTNDSGFITKEVNDLTNYTLKTSTGSSIELSVNSTTYVMTLNLKDINGNTISTGTVDLPLETMVVNATYDRTTKEIVLTLQSGTTVRFSVADLVSGLVSETTFNSTVESLQQSINAKQNEITSTNKLNSDLVDDTNQTNKFVTSQEKNTWNSKYDKPTSGIPKADLASDVQTSLEKADTAIQPTDYASSSKAGVIKTSNSYGTTLSASHEILATTKTYQEYNSAGNGTFISKGTLENVITGKGLVSDTDYATNQKGGVVKIGRGSNILPDGTIYANVYNYTVYKSADNSFFISKGTLENVIVGKELINQTQLDESQAEQDAVIEDIQEVTEKHSNTLYTKEEIEVENNSVVLEDTDENLDLKIVEIESDKLEQKSYTGKNLIDTSYISNILNSNGDTRRGFYCQIPETGNYIVKFENVKQNYYIATTNDLNENSTPAITYGGKIDTILNLIEGQYLLIFEISAQQNEEILVCFSSLGKSYEPYVGGIASPNPSYPQEVEGITGDVTGRVRNENLAYNGWAEDFVRRVNTTLKGDIVNYDGRRCLKFATFSETYLFKTNWKDNTQYTFIFDMLAINSQNVGYTNMKINYTDGTSQQLGSKSTANKWIHIQKTSQSDKTIESLHTDYASEYTYIDLDSFMVIEGTEAPDEFIPYAQSLTLSLGTKTLYKGDKIDILNKQYALKWGRYEFEAGVSSVTITDMKSGGEFYSTVGGTLNGQTITFISETTEAGYVIYERASTSYENITDPTLLSQLNSLLVLKQYNDKTYIEFDQDVYFDIIRENSNITELEQAKDQVKMLIADYPIITQSGTDFQLTSTGDLPMKALPGGRTEQATNYITYKCTGTETGDYYFTYNNINYQFTMPTIEEGSILVFNTETLKLYLDDTEITTTTDNTGTLLTFVSTPNPDYPQAINNVEGDVVVKAENKNILNLEDFKYPTTNPKITYENQKILLNDTINGAFSFSNPVLTANYMTFINQNDVETFKLKAGTYRLYVTNKINILNNENYIVLCKKNIGSRGDVLIAIRLYSEDKKTFILTEDTDVYIGLQTNGSTTYNNTSFNIMLIYESDALNYIPHKENSVTFPLLQGQKLMQGDYLAEDGIHHVRKQVVFDGSDDENWIIYSSVRFRVTVTNFSSPGTNTKANILCDKLITFAKSSLNANIYAISAGDSQSSTFIIKINESIITVTELKTWLQQNPITVEYELAGEEIEAYTPEQQQAYKKLLKIQSYYDVTNISGSSDNLSPIITAEALKSMKALSSEIENIDSRLSLLEE